MKISGISKILGSVGLAALLSTSSFGASLKGIELNENLDTACDKLRAIYKDNKKVKITFNEKNKTCGWDNIMFGFIGITGDKYNEVKSINLPVDVFGFTVFEGAKSISEKYLKSKGSAVMTMEHHTQGKYEYFQGYNLYGQVQVTIDTMFIKLETVSAENPANFN